VSLDEYSPMSLILRPSMTKLLCYGMVEEESEYIKCRGLVRYTNDIGKDGSLSVSIFDFDPASEDEFHLLAMCDVMTVGNMSDYYHSMFMDYHNSKIDCDFLDTEGVTHIHSCPSSVN
jgi:hypothetical protein